MNAYLSNQALQLARGAAALPAAMRSRHIDFLLAAQRPDGGFAGRQGDSDPYYTSFALRGLFILGVLHDDVAERSAAFLRGRLGGTERIIDFLSLVFAGSLLDTSAGIDIFRDQPPRWRDTVHEMLEQLRRDDGGYAKAPSGRASSTYQSFLVVLSRQLIERPLPQPDRMIQFVRSQRCADGGFRDIRAAKRSGTNPTAAAVGVLKVLTAVDTELTADTIRFLAGMQADEGGFRANTRIPVADLLSTFTGLLTLTDLNGLSRINTSAIQRYLEQLELDEGGFYGAAWDREVDVEYTFYGLATAALLAQL